MRLQCSVPMDTYLALRWSIKCCRYAIISAASVNPRRAAAVQRGRFGVP